MKTPLLNSWEAVPTSRGFQWLQAIKQLMGRYGFLFCFFTDEIHFAIHFFPLTLYGVSEAEFCFCSVFFLLGFGPRSEVWAHWKLWEAGSRYDNEACTLRCVSNERGYKGWKLELLSQQMLQLWFCSSNPHSVTHHVIGKLERKKQIL